MCGAWAGTFQDLVKDPHYVKSFKGLSWFACSTQYSQTFCKYFVGDYVDAILDNAFELILNKNMICGYYFDFCRNDFYTPLMTKDYYEDIVKNEVPSDEIKAEIDNNDFLDLQYSK